MPDGPTVPKELRTASVDRIAAALRGVAGTIPIAGGVIAEIVGAIIPNQRIERLTAFVAILDEKFRQVEPALLAARTGTPDFADLVEQALQDAARAGSEERLRYLASAIKRGLEDEQLRHIEKQRLLDLLARINDVEVLILHSHAAFYAEASEFRQMHKEALMGPGWAMTQQNFSTRTALQQAYLSNLRNLGLLEQQFRIPHIGRRDRVDASALTPQPAGDSLTNLGRVLLRFIESEINVPGARSGPAS